MISKVGDDLIFMKRKITFVLDMLKEELTNLETKMEASGMPKRRSNRT